MRIKQIFMIVSLMVIILFCIPGCNKLENASTSGSKLICMSITGKDLEGNEGSATVFSDVITTSGSIINDNGVASLTAVLLDPSQATGTFYQAVIVDQIDVEYSVPI